MGAREILCDENISTRLAYKKWAVKNHPDKIQSKDSDVIKKVTDNFVNIKAAALTVLPDSDSQIDCDNPTTMKPDSPKPDLPKPNLKKANCIRTTENWSKIQRHHRFDKSTFDKKKFNEDMETASPKMTTLLDTIKELDTLDYNQDGKYYKHFIFSDVKNGGYGSKIIASAFIANDYNPCFTSSLKIQIPKKTPMNKTFGVLSSTAMYNTSFNQKHVKQTLKMYNDRPNNIHGENVRFIILDSGFKEGVDLFDVKYVHIFENQKTNADLIQAVGRATRSCGQKGLNFVPNVGWKLHVYQYYLTDHNSNKVFNDFLHYAGIDLNLISISNNLEKMAILSAVDHDLNININKFGEKVEKRLQLPYYGGGGLLGCNGGKCGNRSTKAIPFSLPLFKKMYNKPLSKNFDKLISKEKRNFFCKLLQTDNEFCKKVNQAYLKDIKRNISPRTVLNNQIVLKSNKSSNTMSFDNMLDMKDDIKNMEDMGFEEFQKHINKVFAAYKYKPIHIENNCDDNTNNNLTDVKYTESQKFVTNYFVPNHFAKGLLIWHSVGTGKTCTAISVKSFLFEKMDYSVIWVTRNTLKDDIWKNMYEIICDHIIKEKVNQGHDVTKLKKFLSKKFLPPLSYRQFSNLLQGKNELYKRLLNINGEQDILKNTLVIIDEAHKLYSNDLSGMEKPNMSVIENVIGKSASCKVLLMTGTPITENPMELVSLLNLIKKNDKFPSDIRSFKKEYMSGNEFTKHGVSMFKNKSKGLISYLNRRFDPRQFAQPVFHYKPVELSSSIESKRKQFELFVDCNNKNLSTYDNCENETKKYYDSLNTLLNRKDQLNNEIL